MKLLIKNIKGLVQVREQHIDSVKGADMKELPMIENAWLAIEDGLIADFGEMTDWPGISDWRDLEVLDADGKYILPSWCDSHTHVVFAGSREGEFEDRINGLTYAEIAQRGGGILNSADKIARMTEDELFTQAKSRIENLMRMGTGALEIKSGYGLNLEAELKILRVIAKLKAEMPIPIKSTFLGAHAVPKEFSGRTKEYVAHVISDILPEVVAQNLADYIDVFCEEGYFDLEDTIAIMKAGAEYGLKSKIHVNQFKILGGVAAAVEHNALSVDHLEELNVADIEVLKGSNTFPVSLPSCSFFLGIPYTPVRRLMEAGLAVVLATDYNPGSTPSGNMNFVVSLACIRQKMTPAQAINAATINGAAAMELEQEVGSITPGKRANFFITKPMPSLAYLPYSFGDMPVEQAFVNGVRVQ
jgi:imidazolonepropionase